MYPPPPPAASAPSPGRAGVRWSGPPGVRAGCRSWCAFGRPAPRVMNGETSTLRSVWGSRDGGGGGGLGAPSGLPGPRAGGRKLTTAAASRDDSRRPISRTCCMITSSSCFLRSISSFLTTSPCSPPLSRPTTPAALSAPAKPTSASGVRRGDGRRADPPPRPPPRRQASPAPPSRRPTCCCRGGVATPPPVRALPAGCWDFKKIPRNPWPDPEPWGTVGRGGARAWARARVRAAGGGVAERFGRGRPVGKEWFV